MVAALRDEAANFVGMKVSNKPWESFEPYLVEGLHVFVGPESLIARGLAAGAVGAVSGLASVFPEAVVAAVAGAEAAPVEELRATLERFPFQSAAKTVLAMRGVAIRPDVRAPLRTLAAEERAELEAWFASLPQQQA